MSDLRAKFNDKSDPTWRFHNQCVAFKRVCPECGNRFPSGSDHCIYCGAPRPRCQHKAMDGETVCRQHITGRPYTLYNKLAGTLTDTALEEIIEADDRDLSQEFALARIALSGALDRPGTIDSEKLLKMVKDFFIIAEKKKTIEQGQVLNISWNDELVNSLRLRVRKLIKTFEEVIDEFIEDPQLKKKILTEIRDRTRMPGNLVSSPLNDKDYVND